MKYNLTVPTELKDIRLSQYQKFIKTTKDSEDDRFVSRQLVGIFCDIDNDLVGKIPKKDFNDIVNTITTALSKETKLITKTTYKGKQLGFIPKIEDITLDEQGDLDLFLKDVKTYDKAMKVLYRPVKNTHKDKYLIEDYKGDGEGIDVTLDVVFGAVNFFLSIRKDLLNYILNYTAAQAEKCPKISKALEKNGDGIKSITHYQREMLDGLTRLAK